MRRALLAFALAIAVLSVFIVVVGPVTIAGHLAGTNLWIFGLGFLAMVGAVGVWSEGLRPLLAERGRSPTRWGVGIAYTAAMFGRQVLPLGALGGPAVTAYTVDRVVDLGYDETLAVVTVAEFLSTVASLAMAAMGAGMLLDHVATVPLLRVVLYGTAAFTVVLLVLGVVFVTERAVVGHTVRAVTRMLRLTVGRVSTRAAGTLQPAKIDAALARFYETVDVVSRDWSVLAYVTGLHFVGWLLAAVPLYTSAAALDAAIPPALVLLLVPASGLVDVLPLPGGLGGVEVVLATLLTAVTGMGLPVAAAVVLLYRIPSYWFLLLLGAIASVYSSANPIEPTADAP